MSRSFCCARGANLLLGNCVMSCLHSCSARRACMGSRSALSISIGQHFLNVAQLLLRQGSELAVGELRDELLAFLLGAEGVHGVAVGLVHLYRPALPECRAASVAPGERTCCWGIA